MSTSIHSGLYWVCLQCLLYGGFSLADLDLKHSLILYWEQPIMQTLLLHSIPSPIPLLADDCPQYTTSPSFTNAHSRPPAHVPPYTHPCVTDGPVKPMIMYTYIHWDILIVQCVYWISFVAFVVCYITFTDVSLNYQHTLTYIHTLLNRYV